MRGMDMLVRVGAARVALAILCWPAEALAQDPLPFPRLANMYLQGSVNPADIPALGRWDVLILDPIWTRSQLQQLRAVNPGIRIFFYLCAYCVQVPPPPGNDWMRRNYEYAQANDLWWRNWNRSIASDWPGVQLVNITDRGASGPRGTWRQFFATHVESLVTAVPELDGVFYDNYWASIAWEQGGIIQVDSDCNPTHNPEGCDGVMDTDAEVDTLWNRALRDLARDTRARFDAAGAGRQRPLALITNSSADYFPWLNGTLHEYFPSGNANPDPGNSHGYNWNQEMLAPPGGYLVAPFRADPYRLSILNADWDGTWVAPTRSPDFERHKRFTLVSALLGDGYYSLDAAQTGHGSLWWEPEYDHAGRGKGYLGAPRGPMRRVGEPTGPELVREGAFDIGMTAWRTLAWNAAGSFDLDTATYVSAPASGRIDVARVDAGGSFKLYQEIPVVGGRSYTLRFWARASVRQQLLLHLYDDACPNRRCLGDRRLDIGTEWQLHELSFTATGTANAGLNLFITVPGSVWLDDVSLRQGDTAVYRRDFDGGVVLLNYTNETRTVDLGARFRRLAIPGSSVFDGAEVLRETVPPSDGRILLRGAGPAPAPPPGGAPRPRGSLQQNAPNPFNPATRIGFTLGRDEHVRLTVYDLAGRLVTTLLDRLMAAGVSSIEWNGTDRYGMRVRSGVYLCRIETPTFTQTRKMTLLM